jgi:transcriptional regulator with XRE-family HTH domain
VTRKAVYTPTRVAYAYPTVSLTTTALDRAEALGWSIADLAKRSGLSVETLYKLKTGERAPGPKSIEGLLKAFPNLGYRDLFVPGNSTDVHTTKTVIQPAEPAAVEGAAA